MNRTISSIRKNTTLLLAWIALLVYVLMLWRKLARVDTELRDLSRRIEGRRRS